MKSYIEQRDRYLGPALKLRREGLSYERISKIYPVPAETIRRWCIKFAPELSGNLVMSKISSTSISPKEKETGSDRKALEQRIKELEAQLKDESIRADFYNEMINVAEAKFNIPIRKKAGTKQ